MEDFFTMKKCIIATMMAIILIVISTAAIYAFDFPEEYPSSPSWDWPLPTNGSLLKGEPIGGPSWGDSEAASFDKAYDGDETTIYDPKTAKSEDCYTGMQFDKAYILTEIRYMPRGGQFLERTQGATFQGSNDGVTWTDIYECPDKATSQDFLIITADMFIEGSNTGYTYYRHINYTIHGDVAEIEFYGNPASGGAATDTPKPAETTPAVTEPPKDTTPVADTTPAADTTPTANTTTNTAADTGDSFVLIASLLALAIVSTYIVMRKKSQFN